MKIIKKCNNIENQENKELDGPIRMDYYQDENVILLKLAIFKKPKNKIKEEQKFIYERQTDLLVENKNKLDEINKNINLINSHIKNIK